MKHSVKSKIISVTMAAAMAVSMAVPTFAARPYVLSEEIASGKTGNAVVDSINTAKDKIYNAGSAFRTNAANMAIHIENHSEDAKAFTKDAINDIQNKTKDTIVNAAYPITGHKQITTSSPNSLAYSNLKNKIYGYSANYVNNDTVINNLNKATTDWAAKIMQVPGDTISLMTDSARKAVQNQENIIGVDEVITDKNPATIENALRSLGGWGTITYQPVNHSYSKAGNISYFGNNIVGYDLDPVDAVKTRLTDNQQTFKKYVNGQKGALDNVQSNLNQAKKDFNFGLGDTAENVMKDINSATGNRLNYTIDSGSSILPHISLGK